MTKEAQQIAQIALTLPDLKKVAEATLRSWRWHARKGNHTPDNLQRLKAIHEAAKLAYEEAGKLIVAAATGPEPEPEPEPDIRTNPRALISSVSQIIAYEDGELDEDETIIFFQSLIDCGLVWTLQGSYGRRAQSLIQSGACHRRQS